VKLKFRIDKLTPAHAYFTVFQDNGNCGQLCMNTRAFDILCINLRASDIEFDTEFYSQGKKEMDYQPNEYR
jgi:hypothetical protein